MALVSTCPKPDPDGYYTIQEAAAFLGIHRNTLRIWINNNYIRTRITRSSHRVRIPGKEIIRCWKEQMTFL